MGKNILYKYRTEKHGNYSEGEVRLNNYSKANIILRLMKKFRYRIKLGLNVNTYANDL